MEGGRGHDLQLAGMAAERGNETEDMLARLEARAEELHRKMQEAHREAGMEEAGCSSEDESEAEEYADDFVAEEDGGDSVAEEDGDAPAKPSRPELSSADDEESVPSPPASPASLAAKIERRRGLDFARSVEAERVFEARTGQGSSAPDGGRGEAIAAELRSAAASLLEQPNWPGPEAEEGADEGRAAEPAAVAGSVSSAAAVADAAAAGDGAAVVGVEVAALVTGVLHQGPPGKSTLRRLKQVDAAVSSAVEEECGVCLGKSDIFRLTLETPESRLKPETKVLLVVAGEHFHCEEPIPEETSVGDASAVISEAEGEAGAGADAGADAGAAAAEAEGEAGAAEAS
mmetsp:Transcript_148446/g.476764  ORF Transcript_148446/g.476764 Transcript_148446/m.476764 type:complete len:345 (+) Transcript_148446:105-1139(+)